MSYSLNYLVPSLLLVTTFSICSSQTAHCNTTAGIYEHGHIRVIGIITTNAVAGRMFICDDGKWRAVCDSGWDLNNARVVCHQLGFDPQGAVSCTNSCFGRTGGGDPIKEFKNANCMGNEDKLINCNGVQRTGDSNCNNAGVLCANPPPQLPPPTPCDCSTDCPFDCECPATDMANIIPSVTTYPLATALVPDDSHQASGEGQQSRTDGCTALGGGLGALAVVLALTLVGVVLGWVWHCRRNKDSNESLRMEPETTPPLPDALSPLHLTPDHSLPEYATISVSNPATELGGVATAPNPCYGTSLSTSRPHPSAEPGSGRVCPNPSYAVPKQ